MQEGTGTIARLSALDQRLTRPLTLPPAPRLPRILALGIAHSGDSWVWGGLLVLAWFLGGPSWKARAIVTFVGLVVAEIATVGIKMLVKRQRPAGESGAIYRRMDPYSMPSGHAARAVMLCILSFLMGPAWAFWAILAWSPVMVLSRIAIGIHYVFDVAAGALMGAILTGVVWLIVPLVASRF